MRQPIIFEVVWMLVISSLEICAGMFQLWLWYCSLLVNVRHMSLNNFIPFSLRFQRRNEEFVVMVGTCRKLQSWLILTASSVSVLDLSPHFHGNDILRLIKTSCPYWGHSVTFSQPRLKLWVHQKVLPLSLLSSYVNTDYHRQFFF